TLSSEQVPSQGTTQAEGLKVSSSFSFLQNNSIRYFLPPANAKSRSQGIMHPVSSNRFVINCMK
ncbi:hypothetical protein, partial [[Ruminococcus] lactaris]|uniref:hypothetical protein n=1 Tax=[Ruminococcus] lactaris TaxID=46228 RepID=UPI003FD88F0E